MSITYRKLTVSGVARLLVKGSIIKEGSMASNMGDRHR